MIKYLLVGPLSAVLLLVGGTNKALAQADDPPKAPSMAVDAAAAQTAAPDPANPGTFFDYEFGDRTFRIWTDQTSDSDLRISRFSKQAGQGFDLTLVVERKFGWIKEGVVVGDVDGILVLQGANRLVDLKMFEAEISFIGDSKDLDKVTKPVEGGGEKPVNVIAEVEKNYPNLVLKYFDAIAAAKKQNPEISPLQALEINQPLTENMRQMIRAFKSGESVRFVGDSGIGKSIEIDLLARMVAAGAVPGVPRTAQIRIFDVNNFSAGTRFVGTTETKLEILRAHSKAYRPIIYIDEFHNLKGVGTHSGNPNNILQSLKPALANGEIRIVGVSTTAEWANAYGSDPALNRRFIEVVAKEPSGADLVKKVQDGLRWNKSKVSDPNLIQYAIELSDRFSVSGSQPGKVMTLLKEAQQLANGDLSLTNEEITLESIQLAALNKYKIHESFFSPEIIFEKVSGLNEHLKTKVFGQDPAIEAVSNMWIRKLTDVGTDERANFVLFYGPPGVGKTLTAELSAKYFNYNVRQINMQSYANGDIEAFKKEIYLALKTNPNTVFILDELEKASIHVQNEVLPMIQPGSFSVSFRDSFGQFVFEKVNCKNAVFFGTTNAGQNLFKNANTVRSVGFATQAQAIQNLSGPSLEKLIRTLTDSHISSALISRISDLVGMPLPTTESFRAAVSAAIDHRIEIESKKRSTDLRLQDKELLMTVMMKEFQEGVTDFRQISVLMNKHLNPAISKAVMFGKLKQDGGLDLGQYLNLCDGIL